MQLAMAKGEFYFYILKLKDKNAFKVGVSSNDFQRVKHHDRNYGGINYQESLIVVSPIKKAIITLESQILIDYEEENVANDFLGIDGYTEMLSGDCIHRVIEDVQVKAERFPAKKFRIIRNIDFIVNEPEKKTKDIEIGVNMNLNVPKSLSKTKLSRLYGARDTDVLLKAGERIPLFTFSAIDEGNNYRSGPRYFIAEDCHIIPRAANTLRTREGRKLMAIFIQYGRMPNNETYVLTYGEMVDGLEMSRNIETLVWLQNTACNLWCGASIQTVRGTWGAINYIGGTCTRHRIIDVLNLYYTSDIFEMSEDIWDLELDLNINIDLYRAMQKWFYAPDIPIELWSRFSFDKLDFLDGIFSRHIEWQQRQKK